MNLHYYALKTGLIAAALCIAIIGGSLGTARLQPHYTHSPYTAAVTMQAGIYHAGAKLGHIALMLFQFVR